MRAIALTVIVLVALPAVSALGVPHVRPQDMPPILTDLSDGGLLRLLAAHQSLHPKAPALFVPRGATVASEMQLLAARTHVVLAPADTARFAQLDSRVTQPTIVMLAAVDQAWGMRDAAFAKLTPAEQQELATADSGSWTPRQVQLASQVDTEILLAAAILLLDTTETIVTPAVQTAVAQGVWPPIPIADPAGVLRIGSSGNDVETLDRILQIDPIGDDTYLNNAGGASNVADDLTVNPPLGVHSLGVAVSLDLSGNDHYTGRRAALGGASLGIAMTMDLAGDDTYRCNEICLGSGELGIGYFRDQAGDDVFNSTDFSQGAGVTGYGVFRDDQGNDSHNLSGGGGYAFGSTFPASLGLLWDRQGSDIYGLRIVAARDTYGFDSGGRGYLIDEGTSMDSYATAEPGYSEVHGCNDCEWLAGGSHGRGNDNFGGLAFVLSEDNSLPNGNETPSSFTRSTAMS